jgi:hypothetical protein
MKRPGEIKVEDLNARIGKKLGEHVSRLIDLRDIEKGVKEELSALNEEILPLMQRIPQGTVSFPFASISLYENETTTTLDKKKLIGILLAKGMKQEEIDSIMSMASNVTAKKPYVKMSNGK